ncbi:MAG: hypothetical protein O7I93_12365 [Gemmatimonadetes bacterium]|nr:hypothetical protein [Gemmatimonadota bacterium]
MTRSFRRWLVLTAFFAAPAVAQKVQGGTLLVANMDDDSVWLLDMTTGKRRAVVKTHMAPHEIAVSGDGRRAAIEAGYGAGASAQGFTLSPDGLGARQQPKATGGEGEGRQATLLLPPAGTAQRGRSCRSAGTPQWPGRSWEPCAAPGGHRTQCTSRPG